MAKKRASQKPIPTHEVKYAGETYLLPVVTRGSTLSDEHKLPVVELVCLMYGTGEYSIKECCEACGISTSTFYYWLENNGDFGKLFIKAKEAGKKEYKQLLREAAKGTALRILRGEFTRETVKRDRIYESIAIKDKQGNTIDTKPVQVGMRVTTTEQWLRPTTALILKVMELTEPENYSAALMIAERVDGATTDSILEIINDLRINDEADSEVPPPITSEDDARIYGDKLERPPEK